MAKTTRPMTAPRFSRNAAQNDASGEGCARTAAASSPIDLVSAAASRPWLILGSDDAIDEIDEQIDQHDDGGDQQNAALQRRQDNRAGRWNRSANGRPPARRIIVSVSTAPAIRLETERPITVTTGRSALRNA